MKVCMGRWGVEQEGTKMNQISCLQNAYYLKEVFISQLLVSYAIVTNNPPTSGLQSRLIIHAHITCRLTSVFASFWDSG